MPWPSSGMVYQCLENKMFSGEIIFKWYQNQKEVTFQPLLQKIFNLLLFFVTLSCSSSPLIRSISILYCMKISRHENFAVFGGKIAFRGILISWFRQIDEFRGILILRFEQKMKKVNDLHVLKLCIFTVNCKDFTPCKYTYSSQKNREEKLSTV